MRFSNPNFREVKKMNNNIKEEKVDKKENIVSISEIMNLPKKEKNNIEYINFKNNSIITNVPKSISLSANSIGVLTVKYSNALDSFKMNM